MRDRATEERFPPDLIARFLRGDEAATAAVFVQIRPYLESNFRRRLRNSSDIDDAVAETCFRMLNYRQNLDHPQAFQAWMRKIAHSVLVDNFRRSQRLASETLPDVASSSGSADDNIRRIEVARGLRSLPLLRREPLILCCLEGLDQNEASEIIGISVTAFKSRLQHAKRAARNVFADLMEP